MKKLSNRTKLFLTGIFSFYAIMIMVQIFDGLNKGLVINSLGIFYIAIEIGLTLLILAAIVMLMFNIIAAIMLDINLKEAFSRTLRFIRENFYEKR